MNIPFSKVTIGKEEEEAVIGVMRSGWLAAGEQVAKFEEEFSDYVSPKGEHYYCIFTSSCTSALKMAYKWAKEQGHEWVWYPKNTFCATYSAFHEMGLRGIDPEPHPNGTPNDFSLDANRNSILTLMHYGGVKGKLPKVHKKMIIIEDSAHRIEPNDPLVGKIRCYSFYATKNMTTGSGGMLVTNDKEIYERCRLYWRDGLTNSTSDRSKGNLDYTVLAMAGGYDGNDIAAAIGRSQLKKLPQFTARRNDIVKHYNKELGGSWNGNHLYPYFVSSESEVKELISYLKEKGISTGYHYPNTGWLGVSLPLYPLLTDEEVEYIIGAVKEWCASR